MTIGIVIVCTNAYFILGIRFIKKFMKHYKGNSNIIFYVFADIDPSLYLPNITNIKYFHTTHARWQDGTNSKFKNILELQNEAFDYLYYFDADTNIIKNFTESWFLGELVGGEHYNNCYKNKDGSTATKAYDRNPHSRAYVPINTTLPQMYYYGAFFGGSKHRVIEFCKTNYEDQLADKAIHYEPAWNDESYINRYFHFNPPSVTVPAKKFEFCISDKGGIGETRKTTLDIQHFLRQVLSNPEVVFDFNNGRIKFEQTQLITIDGLFSSLDLENMKIYVLGKESKRILSVLENISSNLTFGTQASLTELLLQHSSHPENFSPFIVVQDCVNIQKTVATQISYPSKSDCIYLGISRYSAANGYASHKEGVEFQKIKDNFTIVKINNMLSSHAYVVLSIKWVNVLLESMKKADSLKRSLDLFIAMQMHAHDVYALWDPLFYQDSSAGGQEKPTKITFDDIVML